MGCAIAERSVTHVGIVACARPFDHARGFVAHDLQDDVAPSSPPIHIPGCRAAQIVESKARHSGFEDSVRWLWTRLEQMNFPFLLYYF